MATTAITEETPMRMPSTVSRERSLLARREAMAMAMASENGISLPRLLSQGGNVTQSLRWAFAPPLKPPSRVAALTRAAPLYVSLGSAGHHPRLIALDLPVADVDGAV